MSIIKSTQKKVEKGAKTLGQAMTLKSYRKLAINFLILTVNLIIIILYFALSEAKVVILPEQELITHSLRITLKAEVGEEEKTQFAAGSVTETTVAASADFTIAADTAVPAAATGRIIIRNTTPGRNQILVANTQFQNEAGTIIRTRKQIELAPGQTITVEAYADQAGPAGEVEPGRFQIVKLPALQDKIYGEVEAKFTGGQKLARLLTPGKYDEAKAELEEKLKIQAAQKLGAKYITIQITKLKATAKPGDRDIASFNMAAEATAKRVTFDAKNARDLAAADLINKLPPNKTLARIDESSFNAVPDADGAYLDTTLRALIQPKFPDAIFNKKAIAGKSREEVRSYFTKITGIKNIEVDFSPFWVRSVPRLDDHVDIEIKK